MIRDARFKLGRLLRLLDGLVSAPSDARARGTCFFGCVSFHKSAISRSSSSRTSAGSAIQPHAIARSIAARSSLALPWAIS